MRTADVTDADTFAHLLHDFITEYGTPTPGVPVLLDRCGAYWSGTTCSPCWSREETPRGTAEVSSNGPALRCALSASD